MGWLVVCCDGFHQGWQLVGGWVGWAWLGWVGWLVSRAVDWYAGGYPSHCLGRQDRGRSKNWFCKIPLLRCYEAFSRFVSSGQSVASDEEVTHTFGTCAPYQEVVSVQLFATPSVDEEFVTEPGMKRQAVLELELPPPLTAGTRGIQVGGADDSWGKWRGRGLVKMSHAGERGWEHVYCGMGGPDNIRELRTTIRRCHQGATTIRLLVAFRILFRSFARCQPIRSTAIWCGGPIVGGTAR